MISPQVQHHPRQLRIQSSQVQTPVGELQTPFRQLQTPVGEVQTPAEQRWNRVYSGGYAYRSKSQAGKPLAPRRFGSC